jgi:hypothetical protein
MADTIRVIIGDSQFSKLASEEAWIGATRVSTIRTQYWQGRPATLPELLWATQYHQGTDLIIKIYAVVGILTSDDQQALWYWLNRARSTMEKFNAVSVWILGKFKNLDIFSYASCRRWEPSQRPTNVASWVPNFGLDGRSMEPLVHGVFGPKDFKDLFNAGRQDSATFSLSEDGSCLTVSGIQVDHILIVEHTFTGQESNAQILDLFNRATRNGFVMKPITSQSVLEVFWRTLHIDQKNGQRVQEGGEQLVRFDPDDSEDGHLWFQQEELFVPQYYKGRQLLVSKNGYICLGPAEARHGDIITVMPGGKVPYLLTKCGGNFKLVGEWYEIFLLD